VLVEVIGEEPLAQGQPPEITGWPGHNYNPGPAA
jgi:hypothetical protein